MKYASKMRPMENQTIGYGSLSMDHSEQQKIRGRRMYNTKQIVYVHLVTEIIILFFFLSIYLPHSLIWKVSAKAAW